MSEKISCLGPEGSFSVLAVQRMRSAGEAILCRNFVEVMRALERGEVDCAVIPIENSIQGGVLQNLDLMERAKVFAVEECVIKIDHRLVTKAGTPLENITKIYSHEQAIGQCSEYLAKTFPNAQLLFTDSTARSLSMVNECSAGIVGSHIQAEGYTLSAQNIANEPNNFTRFLRLVRRGELPKKSEKVFFCAVCKHKPGALLEFLQVFADAQINLTRIESRPIRDVFGEYRFFIELSADIGEKKVLDALEKAREISSQLRLLGAY